MTGVAAVRLASYLALTLALIPVQWLMLRAGGRALAGVIPRRYHRLCWRLLGLEVVIHGRPLDDGPALFACNHLSYLDIPVLAGVLDASFVAKEQVRSWPLFGTLARLQRTEFVSRTRGRVRTETDRLTARLASGDRMILFAEGTSHDGVRVLPFRPALFAALDRIDVPVQPVTVAVTGLDGMAPGRPLRPLYAWYGDMDLVPHLWEFLGLGRVRVELWFHAPHRRDAYPDRKALARACHHVVAQVLQVLYSGRGVPDYAGGDVPENP